MPRDANREAFVLAAVASGERGSDIAATLGISRERVRQIYTRATGQGLPSYGTVCPDCGVRYTQAGDPNAGQAEHRASAEHRTEMVRRAERRQVRRVALFWSQIVRHGPIPDYAPALGHCWIWTGYSNPNGYGHFTGRVLGHSHHEFAHRIAYVLTNGPIPDGLTIDHLCRVRSCVNPDHLEAVTQRENIMRSPIAVAAINARKTHCKRGHPFDDANTYHQRGRPQTRACRACAAQSERHRTARLRAARHELRAAA